LKRVAITGISGLIGIELTKALLKNGDYVTGLDLPEKISKQPELTELLKEYPKQLTLIPGSILSSNDLARLLSFGIETVFHMAAMLGVAKTENYPIECLKVNIKGTEKVLQACNEFKIKRIFFASSSEVYGEPVKNPITEEAQLLGHSVYAVAKIAGESYVKSYAKFHGTFDYVICRFFNTYGENQVSEFVLKKFINKVLINEPPIVFGKGDQVRGYCHASDTANALVALNKIEKPINDVFNIGNSDQPLSLIDLAQIVIKVVGHNSPLQPNVLGSFKDTDRNNEREIYYRFCDTSKLKSKIDFKPLISIQEGIRRIAKK